MSRSPSPQPKRVKLDFSPAPSPQEEEPDYCSICLQPHSDRTLIPTCSHEFCFDCLLVWTEQSRRCPLCAQPIAEYLIHKIRSRYDYQKHYLPPLRTSPRPLQPRGNAAERRRPTRREREWGRRQRREREEADALERAISKRRWIYEHDLYAKHVASNPYTRYRPFPTPAQLSASQDLQARTTAFVRRELRVWPNLDVEFLTTFILSLMKSIDIRSESAVKLLSEFLDMGSSYVQGERYRNAEHFAHELYSYLRSPYRDLFVYDSVAQYDTPAEVSIHIEDEPAKRSRWRDRDTRSRSHSRSPSPEPGPSRTHRRRVSRSRSRSRSRGRSPSSDRSRGHERSQKHARSGSMSPPPGGHSPPERKHEYGSSRLSMEDQPKRRERQSKSRSHTPRRFKGVGRTSFTDVHAGGVVLNRKGKDKAWETSGVQALPAKTHGNRQSYIDLTEGDIDFPIVIDAQDNPEQTVIPLQTRNNENDHRADGNTSSTHVTQVEKRRPVRNLNLQESVQAHLSGSGRARKQAHVQPSPRPVSQVHTRNDATTPPLLSPVVDAAPAHGSVNREESTQQKEDHDPRPTTATLPAPAIMVRTRLRLARMKGEPVGGVSPSVSTPKAEDEDTLEKASNSGAGGREDGGATKATVSCDDDYAESSSLTFQPKHATSEDLRRRLLNKLEEEKKQTQEREPERTPVDQATSVDRSSRVSEPQPIVKDPSTGQPIAVNAAPPANITYDQADRDSLFAEARLRAQAQLRIRLAAAKRSAQDRVGSTPLPEEGRETREVALRNRLLARRR